MTTPFRVQKPFKPFKQIGNFEVDENSCNSDIDDETSLNDNQNNEVIDQDLRDSTYTPDLSNSSVSEQETTVTRERTRKRKINTAEWNRKGRKLANLSGKRQVNSQNKIKDKRNPKPLMESHKKCRFKCEDHFDEEKHKLIYKEYWGLGDYARQRDVLLYCVTEYRVSRKGKDTLKHHSVSREYYFVFAATIFHQTLAISTKTTECTLKKRSVANTVGILDMRVKATPSNKTPKEKIDRVKKCI